MKRNAWIIVGAALLIMVIGTFVLWKTVGNPCVSPVMISKMDAPLDTYSPDKSGAKRVKMGMDGNLSSFQYYLEPGKKTRTTYDPTETLMIIIFEGKGALHSAHFTEKQDLIWFQEAPVEPGNFLTIPANIAYQLEASNDSPLRYLIFGTKGTQAKERLFLREEHPSTYPCRPREESGLKKMGELNPDTPGVQTGLDRTMIQMVPPVDHEVGSTQLPR